MRIKKNDPFILTELTEKEAARLKAVYHGNGTKEDQIAVFDLILRKFCMVIGAAFDENDRVHAFNEGKRKVGLDILFYINEPLENIFKPKKEKKP